MFEHIHFDKCVNLIFLRKSAQNTILGAGTGRIFLIYFLISLCAGNILNHEPSFDDNFQFPKVLWKYDT
jgi:hypothetical protein